MRKFDYRLFEHGAFRYYYNLKEEMVYDLEGEEVCRMSRGWHDSVLSGENSVYRFEKIPFYLENK